MTHQLKKRLQAVALLTLLTSSMMAHAELYKWVDEEGNISYSDQPPHKNAREHVPPGLTVTPAVPVPAKDKPAPENKPAETSYKLISIISPAQDETIRNNQGNINIKLNIEPALNLKQGHSITLLLDNQPIQQNLSSSSIALSNIDRGTHQITAIIKNKQGKTLKQSSTITVHLHRHSALKPKPL